MTSRFAVFILLLAAMASPAAASPPAGASDLSAPGPLARLQGTLQWPISGAPTYPVILIIPGSGPTDRDGNNPLGVRAAPYRLLAEALANHDIASVRIDKRGIAASAGAVADGNAVTVADYVTDVEHWLTASIAATGAPCIWLAGHSEGGLIALASADDRRVCGVILIAAPGRRFQMILREQLGAGLAGTPLITPANAAIDALAAGQHVLPDQLPGPLAAIFAPPVQDYIIDLMRQDPSAMIARLNVPTLILQGGADLQVGEADARALATAQPSAQLAILPRVNHVLKELPADADRATNAAAYGNASLPIAVDLVAAVTNFVIAHPSQREN